MTEYKCIVCEKTMEKREKPKKARSSGLGIRYFRQGNAITCSHKCSRIYTRVKAHIWNKFAWFRKNEKRTT